MSRARRDADGERTLVRMSVVALGAFLLVYWSVVVTIQSKYALQPWVTGDWLINYSSGFVRRGLIGEAVRQLYYVAGMNPISAILAAKAFLYAVICIAVVLIALQRRFDVFDFALAVSPAAFPFAVYDALGSGRKEIALLAAFAVYVALDILIPTDSVHMVRRWQFWFLVVALPFLALVHEGLVFFFPFFLVYNWVKHDRLAPEAWAFGLAYAMAGGVFLLSYVFQGNGTTSATICSSLTGMSLDQGLCAGAIEALRAYPVKIRSQDVARYACVAVCAFAPLMWYAARTLNVTQRHKLLVAASLSTAATAPLYVISEDWGRWIHITWMLTFVSVLAFKAMPLRLPRHNRALIPVYALTIVTYVFSWQIPHWIHSALPILKWNPYSN